MRTDLGAGKNKFDVCQRRSIIYLAHSILHSVSIISQSLPIIKNDFVNLFQKKM